MGGLGAQYTMVGFCEFDLTCPWIVISPVPSLIATPWQSTLSKYCFLQVVEILIYKYIIYFFYTNKYLIDCKK